MLFHRLVSIYFFLIYSMEFSAGIIAQLCFIPESPVQWKWDSLHLILAFSSKTSTSLPSLCLVYQMSSGTALPQSLCIKGLFVLLKGNQGCMEWSTFTRTHLNTLRASVIPMYKENGAISGTWAWVPHFCHLLPPCTQDVEILIHHAGCTQWGHLMQPLVSFASFLPLCQLCGHASEYCLWVLEVHPRLWPLE